MIKPAYYLSLLGAGLLGLLSFKAILDDEPSPARTPAEELAMFQVEPGLKIQLVAAEPMVQDPVVMTFDEDGRLWVVEMRGFMPTIDGEGEKSRLGAFRCWKIKTAMVRWTPVQSILTVWLCPGLLL